jgi:hypothetical protein
VSVCYLPAYSSLCQLILIKFHISNTSNMQVKELNVGYLLTKERDETSLTPQEVFHIVLHCVSL